MCPSLRAAGWPERGRCHTVAVEARCAAERLGKHSQLAQLVPIPTAHDFSVKQCENRDVLGGSDCGWAERDAPSKGVIAGNSTGQYSTVTYCAAKRIKL